MKKIQLFSTIAKFRIVLNRRQKRNLIILFLITIVGTCFEVLGVAMMLPLVSTILEPDIIEKNETIAEICCFFGLRSYRTFAILCIAALILIFVIKDLFLILQNYAQTRFLCNNRFALQKKMFDAIIAKPYETFLNLSSSEIIKIVQSDTTQVFNLLSNILIMASESIVALGIVATILFIDYKMTMFVALMMGIIMFFITRISRPIVTKEGAIFQKNVIENNKWLIQAIGGIKEVKVMNKETFFENRYELTGSKVAKSELIYNVSNGVPRLVIEMVAVCTMLGLVGIELFLGKDITVLVPTLGAFAMAALKLMPSANRIVSTANCISYNMPALDSLIKQLRMLESETILQNDNDAASVYSSINLLGEIELKDISYAYPNSNRNVLDKISLKIERGKTIGIIGASGSGKTTLVDVLLGLLSPQEGGIYVDDVCLPNDKKIWTENIGYIPQTIFLTDESLTANVAFGVNPDEIDRDRVNAALRDAQLESVASDLPLGIDTPIGERGIRLSGGQRQRIGIARALYNNPDILIFDEATSSLDNDTEREVMNAINSLHGRKTIVIIAHRLQTIENCDCLYEVKNGKVERIR